MDVSLAQVVSQLQSLSADDKVVICAHCRPDGDAIGSTIALYHALKAKGCQVYALLADNVSYPRSYRWLEGVTDYITPAKAKRLGEIDLFIALDTPDSKRLSAALPLLESARASLLIDHHPMGEHYAMSRYVDTSASATAEIIWEIVKEFDLGLREQIIATACYVALCTDTGRFMFGNTTPKAFRTAAELLEAGAPINDVHIRLYNSKSPSLMALEARILEHVSFYNDGLVCVSYLTQEDFSTTGAKREEAENIIDLIRVIDGTEVAILVTFGATGTRVSLRSKREFNVAEVAGEFGGGGHKAAAGVTWPDSSASLEEIVGSLLPLLPAKPTVDTI